MPISATFGYDRPDGTQWEVEVTGEVAVSRVLRATRTDPEEGGETEVEIFGLRLLHDGTQTVNIPLDYGDDDTLDGHAIDALIDAWKEARDD
jgi:hypothetical protein